MKQKIFFLSLALFLLLPIINCNAAESVCGNGIWEQGEVCDPAISLTEKCTKDSKYDFGTLKCSSDCQSFDFSECKTYKRVFTIDSIKLNSPFIDVVLNYQGDIPMYMDHFVSLIVKENDVNGVQLFNGSKSFHASEVSQAPKPGDNQTASFEYKILPNRKYYIEATLKYYDNTSYSSSKIATKKIIIGDSVNQTSLTIIKPDLKIVDNSIRVDNENVSKADYLMLNYINYDVANLSEKQILDKWSARTEIFSGSLSGKKIYDETVKTSSLNNSFNDSAFFDIDGKKLFTVGSPYVVRINLDSTNIIDESNENNNSATLSFVFGKKSEPSSPSVISDLITAPSDSNNKIASNTLATTAPNNLRGKILIQVESHGEAWYINPKDGKRYYMANGSEALKIMKKFGAGMSNKDMERIKTDVNFRKKFMGKILLQVESHGEAYYISFDGRYNYLKDGESALTVMKKLGLGISNANLEKIVAN